MPVQDGFNKPFLLSFNVICCTFMQAAAYVKACKFSVNDNIVQ